MKQLTHIYLNYCSCGQKILILCGRRYKAKGRERERRREGKVV